MITIRFAEKKDSELIYTFIKALATYEKLAHEVIATKEQLEKFLFGKKAYAEVLIASFDNIEVGFALFFTNFSTFLSLPGIYLEDLFVKPQFRGKGIGKALLIELVKIANERGFGRVEWAVLDWNEPAIEFYKSLGAVPQNDWTVYRIKADQFESLLRL
jgi:GNAT superfamily N-acetyltransferase